MVKYVGYKKRNIWNIILLIYNRGSIVNKSRLLLSFDSHESSRNSFSTLFSIPFANPNKNNQGVLFLLLMHNYNKHIDICAVSKIEQPANFKNPFYNIHSCHSK